MSTALAVAPERRPWTISTESGALLWAAVAGTVAISLVTFVLSAAGLAAVAEWANIDSRLRWMVPVFLDGAILVYTAAALVQRGRGQTAGFTWVVLGGFAAVSVAANAAHAWSMWADMPFDWRGVVGTLIAALPPVGQFAATHTVARLIVVPPTAPLGTPAMPPEREGVDAETAREEPRDSEALRETEAGTEAHRDAQIIAGLKVGKSVREIAADIGWSRSTVGRAKRRLERDGQLLTQP